MDILDEMTKDEIIGWVRGQVAYMSHPPKKSDLLWCRWERQEKKISDRRKANMEFGGSLKLAKRDEIARQFNATEDTGTRLSLLKKMTPYEKKWQAYLSESRAVMKAEEKVNKLYNQIEIERTKERERQIANNPQAPRNRRIQESLF